MPIRYATCPSLHHHHHSLAVECQRCQDSSGMAVQNKIDRSVVAAPATTVMVQAWLAVTAPMMETGRKENQVCHRLSCRLMETGRAATQVAPIVARIVPSWRVCLSKFCKCTMRRPWRALWETPHRSILYSMPTPTPHNISRQERIHHRKVTTVWRYVYFCLIHLSTKTFLYRHA